MAEVDTSDLKITPLGAGGEVGRSCFIVSFMGRSVMLDCGIHPAYSGIPALPFFDKINLSNIDVLLVSHFHLDHCGSVPYLTEKTTFNGRVLMTHPTKAVFKILMEDYVGMTSSHSSGGLFDRNDLTASLTKISLVNYHQVVEHNGIKCWCYNAGHVIGACMWMIEINEVRLLYTGDFSRVEDRHLPKAEVPAPLLQPHVLMIESTYGVQTHIPRESREDHFKECIRKVVHKGGRCILPVFALGRAQEILLILEEMWENEPELQHVPVYYASNLASKAMIVFRTFINMMNEVVWKSATNPFEFKHIKYIKNVDEIAQTGPCVVMASPGMLQNGISRDLFESWANDEKNGVLFTGYAVEGTLAKTVMNSPNSFISSSANEVPLKCNVDMISFSAHSDFDQTSQFIRETNPKHVVLIHGDESEMRRLHDALRDKFDIAYRRSDKSPIHIYSPKNTMTLSLKFAPVHSALVVGDLATEQNKKRKQVRGLIVREHFSSLITRPDEISLHTRLHRTVLRCTQAISCNRLQWNEICHVLTQVYESCIQLDPETGIKDEPMKGEKLEDNSRKPVERELMINDEIRLSLVNDVSNPGYEMILIKWKANPLNDSIVDSVVAFIAVLQSESSELTDSLNNLTIDDDEKVLRLIASLVNNRFGNVTNIDVENLSISADIRGESVVIDYASKIITCENGSLQEELRKAVRSVENASYAVPL